MVSRQLRSRSKKRRNIRTPGGKMVIHYGKKKPKKHHCGRCGKELHGTPNAIPSKVRKMRKTERIPERPYAGILCGECMENLMRYKTKFEIKFNYPEFQDMDFQRDLTIEKFLPRGWWQEISHGVTEITAVEEPEIEEKKAEEEEIVEKESEEVEEEVIEGEKAKIEEKEAEVEKEVEEEKDVSEVSVEEKVIEEEKAKIEEKEAEVEKEVEEEKDVSEVSVEEEPEEKSAEKEETEEKVSEK